MARHACRPLAQAGFTLLEILVVELRDKVDYQP